MTPEARLELVVRELADLLREYVRAAVADEVAVQLQRHPGPEWVTAQKAARDLGITPNAVRMRVARGQLEGRTEGRRVLVRVESVRRAGGELR